MLGHPVRDMAQVTAYVGERRPVAQQVRGQRVPGLVGNVVAEVHGVHPGPEPAVEPLVGQRHRAVLAAVDGREQREPGALPAVGPVAVAGGETVQGLALPFGQLAVEALGDADRLVVVAGLGLVVPEHRQPAVAADAVPPQLDDLADAAPGDDGGLPDVADAAVAGVISRGQLGQVGLVGERAGNLVGEGPPRRPARGGAGCRDRDDELAVQSQAVGGTVLEGVPQQLAGVVEHDRPRGGGDGARGAARPRDRQRGQALALAVPLVGDEPVHVLAAQDGGIVAAARGLQVQESAQLCRSPPQVIDRAGAARASRRSQQAGDVVPGQVPQPALRDAGQVDVAHAVREQHPEVLGLQEPGLLRLVRGEVDQAKLVQDLLDDRPGLLRAAIAELQVDQRPGVLLAAGGGQRADPAKVPPCRPFPLRVHEQPPLDLGPRQRPEAPEVDLPGPRLGRHRLAPPAEARLVGVADRRRLSVLLPLLPPLLAQRGPARAAVAAVAGRVPGTQAQGRLSQVRADRHGARAVAAERLLLACPLRETGFPAPRLLVIRPPGQVLLA